MPNFTIPIEVNGKVHDIRVTANNIDDAKKLAKEKIKELIKEQYGKDLRRRPPFAK